MEEPAQRLLAGDRRTLSRLITLLEKGDLQAAEILKSIDPHTGRAYVIGVTGPPRRRKEHHCRPAHRASCAPRV